MKPHNYLLFIAFWWWMMAGGAEGGFPKEALQLPKRELAPPSLSSLSREELRRALEGDFDQMVALVTSWDVDAAILEKLGKKARRLTSSELMKMQLLRRALPKEGRSDIAFFPQTYLSAALLLTLGNKSPIISLPDGFRRQKEIYSPHFTAAVLQDTDPGKSETFFSSKPTVAFLAPYSHPRMRLELEKRGAHLIEGKLISSMENLHEAILQVGYATDEIERAEMLSLFVKAAEYHFLNCIANSTKRPLYLKVSSTLSSPKRETLLGEFLEKCHFDCDSFTSTPKTVEELTRKKPSLILLSAIDKERALLELSSHSGFSELLEEGTEFAFLDWHLQETLSHFFLLACFDVVSLLAEGS